MNTTEKMPKTLADEMTELTGKCVSLIERMAIIANKRIDGDGEWKEYCEEYELDNDFWTGCIDDMRTDAMEHIKELSWYFEGLLAMVKDPYNELI